MSYHIEGNGRFNNLPERILLREDGYMASYKFDGEPIVDYWYVPEAENAKLCEQLEYDRQTSRSRLERIDQLKAENDNLREYAAHLLDFIDPAAHQSGCNRICPAYKMCVGSTRCMFVDWAVVRARELGIEADR